MKDVNDKSLKFVLKYYQKGRLDTDKALRKIEFRTGHRQWLRSWQGIAAAASLLLIVGIGTFSLFNRMKMTMLRAGANAMICNLKDGSQATLAPNSSLSYKGENCRKVQITGKVYLKIRHDAARPFEIEDADYVINDLGTELEIDENSGGTRVYVTQGSVRFAAVRSNKSIVLHHGMGAVLAKNGTEPQPLERTSINDVAWATHQFHFDGTPLPEVLNVLSDYYNMPLRCKATGKRLSGDFDTANLDDIIMLIEQTLDVKIMKEQP